MSRNVILLAAGRAASTLSIAFSASASKRARSSSSVIVACPSFSAYSTPAKY
jgi:hypothetical protein